MIRGESGFPSRLYGMRESMTERASSENTVDGILRGFMFCPGRDVCPPGAELVGNVLHGFLYRLDGLRFTGKEAQAWNIFACADMALTVKIFKDGGGRSYGIFRIGEDGPGVFRYGAAGEYFTDCRRAYSDVGMLIRDLSALAGASRDVLELEFACLGVQP